MHLCWLNFISGFILGWSSLTCLTLKTSKYIWIYYFSGKLQHQAIKYPLYSHYSIEAFQFSKSK